MACRFVQTHTSPAPQPRITTPSAIVAHGLRRPAVTIAGVGSLLSPASARESFDFSNFRLGEVRGWRRCFCQANWVTVVCGASRLETNEVAALAMAGRPNGSMPKACRSQTL
ncbi:unnamed protein product [Effrenium voratum]|uniref:Uncharacterized protein n=1 Tax=Effrenium voratum TaxID=2562239 RepID=A0AA36NB02_9DINO|nr:unnamed protein product [Effrenium voratum]